MVQAQTHQTCPGVPQTPRRPDAQTPARRLPVACQTQPDAARRSRRQGSSDRRRRHPRAVAVAATM
eukprot:5178419-Prymnesium_polylepis.1